MTSSRPIIRRAIVSITSQALAALFQVPAVVMLVTEGRGDTKPAMIDYLSWETDLLPRLERDGYLDLLRSG